MVTNGNAWILALQVMCYHRVIKLPMPALLTKWKDAFIDHLIINIAPLQNTQAEDE